MASYPMDLPYTNGGHDDILQGITSHEQPIPSPYHTERTGVPLVCHICPKNSKFSDISHLLTHISSKGHLAQYFELSIARDTDEDAAFALQTFDTWFENNGISQMLRMRKAARAEKGNQPQRRSQTPRNVNPGRLATRGGNRRPRGRRGNASSRGRCRRTHDPLGLKGESREGIGFRDSYDGAASPSFHPWETNLTTLMPHGGDGSMVPQEDFGDFGDEEDSSKYEPSEGASSFPSENISEPTDMTETDTGSLVLKGIVYPGMGGFDAAKEEQRRKRNQRKPLAVLQQLEINSALVTTEESVLDCSLNHQRTRDVYDEPSMDGSEDEDHEESVDRRRKRRGSQVNTTSTSKKMSSSHDKARVPRTTRATRSTTRASQSVAPPPCQALDSGGRVTRSATNRSSMSQAQLPLHNHGLRGQTDVFNNHMDLDNGGGWPFLPIFAGNTPANIGQQQILSALPMLGEDGTSSSNPYLHSTDSIQSENYNPLYVQPRDGLGFRMYTSYDEHVKPGTTSFQPINDHGEFNSIQMPGHHNADYHSNQADGDNFNL
ncbi:hypothetical protein AAE478_001065 [Parahypoxylon ruwenzoriense]